MYVVAVSVWVKAEFVGQFKAATLENARNTRHEVGNVRFDVSQGEEDPSRFLLYECYRRKEDFVSHQQTPHYLTWKGAVAEWMAQPRQGVKYKSVFFGEDGE
jgi:autoinducer 2-degrading protein